MATEIRTSGIDVVGDMVAWGAHFCLFYETKEDLLDTLTSYCRSGLERGEYCLWIVAEPLTIEEARAALKDAVPDVDRHLADARLEMAPALPFRTIDVLNRVPPPRYAAQFNFHNREFSLKVGLAVGSAAVRVRQG